MPNNSLISGQNTTNVSVSERSLGMINGFSTSDSSLLGEMYPDGPVNGTGKNVIDSGEYTPGVVKDEFRDKVMRGLADAKGYWAWKFGAEFNRDYVGIHTHPPDNTIKVEGEGPHQYKGGDPINSFIPNTAASPNADSAQQPAPGEIAIAYADDEGRKGSAPFVGAGTLLSPAKARENFLLRPYCGWPIEGDQIGGYLSGYSGATDDG